MTYIYAIQHNVTKKMYIGKTKDVYKRYYQHLCELRLGKHRSPEMQEDFNKYGKDFSVYVLEEIENGKKSIRCNGHSRTAERVREIYWMEKYDTLKNGYNKQDSISQRMINNVSDAFPLKEGLPEVGDN